MTRIQTIEAKSDEKPITPKNEGIFLLTLIQFYLSVLLHGMCKVR